MKIYDIVIIGSGPGGYISAIRSSQLNLKTAIIEKYPSFGGTCLNVGCIPSKIILDSSEHYYQAKKNFSNHGIFFKNLSLNFKTIINKKNNTIKKLNKGIQYILKKNKIDLYEGIASFQDKNHIIINKKKIIKFHYAIIATGSKPSKLPCLDKKKIITSTEALNFSKIPKKIVIIGGGVIGLELGSAYNKLGTQVSIIESNDRIISNLDHDIGKEIKKILENTGINFYLSTYLINSTIEKNKVKINAKIQNKKNKEFICDYCLLAIGRIPYTKGLSLNKIGIKKNKKGFISVNKKLQTNINNIYAIGDVIGNPMLAHKASEEGIFVVESLVGQKPSINYELIPSVIYTSPEVASIGKTENELKKKNIKYKIGNFPMKSIGRAHINNNTEGFVKILSHKNTDQILGVHIIGSRAVDLIMELAVAMEFKASSEDIARICHPHPSFSEAIKESALSVANRALHS